MAILWLDGFDSYGTSNGSDATGINHRYTAVQPTNWDVTDGRVSGKAIRAVLSNPSIVTPVLGNIATIVVGFAFRYTFNTGSADITLMSLKDGSNFGVNIRIRPDGDFVIYRNTTILATAVGSCIGANVWAFLELKVTTHNTLGTVEFRINGETVVNLTNQDTQTGSNAYVDTVGLFGHNASADQHDFDDFYVLDTSGSVNNDFLGSRKVNTIFPTAEGDQIDWTPSTGSDNSALVDDNPHNSDTDYVSSGTSGHQDIYQHGDLSGSGDIDGLQAVAICRQTDATPFSIKLVAKSGSTVDTGSGVAIGGTTYVGRHRTLEENPDTTNPWTASEVNSAQFGIEVA